MEDCRLQEETDQLGVRKGVQVGSFLSNVRLVRDRINCASGFDIPLRNSVLAS